MIGRLRRTGAPIDETIAPQEPAADVRDLRARVEWILRRVVMGQGGLPEELRDEDLSNACLDVHRDLVQGRQL